ncbi:MAG: 50S ribosomal protein L18 [Patescibacteria group bacterium]
MNQKKSFNAKKARRVVRVRARISGSAVRPRLAVLRSNRGLSVQLIDDVKGHTLANASSKGVKGSKTDQARKVGESISKKAKELGISQAVFDRRHYRYHGRVRALAEGARSGGLNI